MSIHDIRWNTDSKNSFCYMFNSKCSFFEKINISYDNIYIKLDI